MNLLLQGLSFAAFLGSRCLSSSNYIFGDFAVDICVPTCSSLNFVKVLPIYHRSIVHNLFSLSQESSTYEVNSWMETKVWSASVTVSVWRQRIARHICALQVLLDNRITNTKCMHTYSGKFCEQNILKEILSLLCISIYKSVLGFPVHTICVF